MVDELVLGVPQYRVRPHDSRNSALCSRSEITAIFETGTSSGDSSKPISSTLSIFLLQTMGRELRLSRTYCHDNTHSLDIEHRAFPIDDGSPTHFGCLINADILRAAGSCIRQGRTGFEASCFYGVRSRTRRDGTIRRLTVDCEIFESVGAVIAAGDVRAGRSLKRLGMK